MKTIPILKTGIRGELTITAEKLAEIAENYRPEERKIPVKTYGCNGRTVAEVERLSVENGVLMGEISVDIPPPTVSAEMRLDRPEIVQVVVLKNFNFTKNIDARLEAMEAECNGDDVP